MFNETYHEATSKNSKGRKPGLVIMGKKVYLRKFSKGPCVHVYASASGDFRKGDRCMVEGRADLDGMHRCFKHKLLNHTRAVILNMKRLIKDFGKISQEITKLKAIEGLTYKAATRFGPSWDIMCEISNQIEGK